MLDKYCLLKAKVCSAALARDSQPKGHHEPTVNVSMLTLSVTQLCQKNQVFSELCRGS